MENQLQNFVFNFNYSFLHQFQAMMRAILCHTPSGGSSKVLSHYAQLIKYNFFGKYMNGPKIPPNFNLSRISIPLTLHYSTVDPFTNPKDAKRLISELSHVVHVHVINGTHAFNHMDFLWSKNAASEIHSKVINFFELY